MNRERSLIMDQRLIDTDDLRSVLKKVGIQGEESSQCMSWISPKIEEPLTPEDTVLVEMTREEEGFLRCMGYAYEEKVVDSLRLAALHETFWNTVRSLHNLPRSDLTVKGGKYIVAI
jgi:hypothetical protein